MPPEQEAGGSIPLGRAIYFPSRAPILESKRSNAGATSKERRLAWSPRCEATRRASSEEKAATSGRQSFDCAQGGSPLGKLRANAERSRRHSKDGERSRTTSEGEPPRLRQEEASGKMGFGGQARPHYDEVSKKTILCGDYIAPSARETPQKLTTHHSPIN